MPRIFDNIDSTLLPALQGALGKAYRADFCVGYLNLRGWRGIADGIEGLEGGEGRHCRLLVGMTRGEDEALRRVLTDAEDGEIDLPAAVRQRRDLVEDLRQQLMIGRPTAADEAGLRRLIAQLRAGKLVVKLFLRHQLHAKLYLVHRDDEFNPRIGFVGSSNLTFSGLSRQGELNLETVDADQGTKLARWFEDRWADRFSLDITADLIEVLEESWASERILAPYLIYLKMVYHLSREARAGLVESMIPEDLADRLLPFQRAAVLIAARYVRQRGGVLLGDVVGLGKTLMATALARLFQDEEDSDVLILCPKNLVSMWELHRDQFRLRGRVLSLSRVQRDLPDLRAYRLVIVDESHNLRNPEGKRHQEIREYVARSRSRVVLLSATPYNKTYRDLSSQLALFLDRDEPLPVRPERLLRDMGEAEFQHRHQRSPATLGSFELSPHADDWRELMRFFLIRRTRSFVAQHYAERDPETGRPCLTLEGGRRVYFPARLPRTVRYDLEAGDPAAELLDDDTTGRIEALRLPRYGLGQYVRPTATLTDAERQVVADLTRAGARLRGFCRVGLFKRLESCGASFVLSVERHVLRNRILLFALETNQPVPIGPQEAAVLDGATADVELEGDTAWLELGEVAPQAHVEAIYADLRGRLQRRFRFLPAEVFTPALAADLRADAESLERVLARVRPWQPSADRKLAALRQLLTETHAGEKVLVFSEFADTVAYLERELALPDLASVTGAAVDPSATAARFSPRSNGAQPANELRVLLATDVLSEGQNLQDARVVVNYDLPWAIIRLIQRVGRVDRLGQEASEILCYSFLPAEGVERILRLRARVRARLRENAEVVGTDEEFFEEEREVRALHDLYHEQAAVLDSDLDDEVDLASHAYQIWKNATASDPTLADRVARLPDVVHATKAFAPELHRPAGALVYVRTAEDLDELGWVDETGRLVSQSPLAVLTAASCHPDSAGLPRAENHHELVTAAVTQLVAQPRSGHTGLGRPSEPRHRVYERLKRLESDAAGTLFSRPELAAALDALYHAPLQPAARDLLKRLLRNRISDADLAETVLTLHAELRFVIRRDERTARAPRILCSLGLHSS